MKGRHKDKKKCNGESHEERGREGRKERRRKGEQWE